MASEERPTGRRLGGDRDERPEGAPALPPGGEIRDVLLYTPVHRSRSVGPTGHHEPANAVGMIRRQLQRERAWENHGPTILPGRCAGS